MSIDLAAGLLTRLTPEQVATIVDNFRAGTVALLDRHFGKVVGWVVAVMAHDRDIWFGARIEDQGLAERLRLSGPLALSVELERRGVPPLPDEPGTPVLPGVLVGSGWPYIARPGPGWTMVGIAILRPHDQPAAPGSCLWTYVPTDEQSEAPGAATGR